MCVFVTSTYKDLALRLYDLGFNVVPVDSDKRPLCKWSSSGRAPREELVKLLDRATGIAIVGGPENPWKPVVQLVIIDIDNPSVLDNLPILKTIVESSVRWYTGPRCPQCNNKKLDVLEPGKRFKCSSCNIEFNINEAKRGMATLITVDNDTAEKYLRGTRRGKDIEILISNYQLIPPSIHPSGVRYEWIRGFDFNAPNLGIRALVEPEAQALLEELGGSGS